MSEIDLRKLWWGNLSDWSDFVGTRTNIFGTEMICKGDIYSFFNCVIRDISRKMNMPYESVKKIIEEENEHFLRYVDVTFEKGSYSKDSAQVQKLYGLLIVPRINYTISNILEMYNRLSESDKEEFNRRIN